MVFQNDILAGSSGGSGTSTAVHTIDQSIRFNPADSTYMSRAVGSGGNTKTWTFSCWFKIGVLGSQRSVSPFLWACHQSDGNRLQLSFDSGSLGVAGDYLSIYDGASASVIFRTNRVFRDPSAWYNLVLVADTSNTVSSERFRVYVNGQRETSFSTFNAPSLNADLGWNQNGSTYYLGSYFASQGTYAFDGYIAEMVHIDGTALEPSNFAETNSNGIWIPKDVSGLTFGTKGFYIDGRDSADLGDDESGNGNDFTTSGLSADDQRSDSPTDNHATWNPLVNAYTTFANGNIETTITTSYAKTFTTFTLPSSGTWYWEAQEFNNVINPATALGIVDADVERLDDTSVSNRLSTPMSTFTGIVVYSGPSQSLDTYYFKNGVNTSTTGTPIVSTSRLGFKYDADNNTFTVYDDGVETVNFTSVNTGNYVFGVNKATGGANVSMRLLVDANDWTETPSGITSANALTSKNVGS